MGLPCGIWSVILGLIWLAKGEQGDTFYNPLGNAAGVTRSRGDGDDILDINKDLVPQEAPESSFLMEGDIVKTGHSRALSVVSPRWLKRKGVVRIPYILSHVYDAASMAVIQEAFADFARFTCVKFVPRSYQKDFISILPVAGCFSSVGRAGGMQVVSLDPACLQKGKGVALHELMHVVGFWHEHSRADRDKYIKISWNNILTGFEVNFMKAWTTNMLVGYDYSSILHYGRYAFSRTGWPTITPLADPPMALGQRHYLSHLDIARVNRLYKCSQTGMELGGFLSLKAPSIHWAPGKMAAVISPTFHGIGCIFFWYRPMGSGMSTINVYLQYEGSPAWHRVWSAKGQQSTGWQRMTMETFRMQRLQVVLEGVLGPDAGSEVHIVVAICGALCLATCARQLQLCTSPN
ncbi:astacin-like metalloendopeptidase isoform X7 [Alligator mississippiensis]|uniref:astacin-like metalloendopeptidase isoform X7 n=1 Tax=Alligator mississippiensis TaxID=8496 RepID=UPI0028779E0B|nr:astacin-like metalloendopeptidase isoform X7 [Alligator mississippiensis]